MGVASTWSTALVVWQCAYWRKALPFVLFVVAPWFPLHLEPWLSTPRTEAATQTMKIMSTYEIHFIGGSCIHATTGTHIIILGCKHHGLEHTVGSVEGGVIFVAECLPQHIYFLGLLSDMENEENIKTIYQ